MNRYLELYEAENGILIRPVFAGPADRQWEALLALGRELHTMAGQMGGRWLLLSDPAVYGKVYGTPHALREDEMGYVCHASAADGTAWMWRMAEQIFFDTLKERGLSGSVARVDADWSLAGLSRQDLTRLERLLKEGKDGEAYNIDLGGNREVPETETTPLRPLPLHMDTRKEGTLR